MYNTYGHFCVNNNANYVDGNIKTEILRASVYIVETVHFGKISCIKRL